MKDNSRKFREEILSSVQNRKGDVADAIGMPDDEDYRNLVRIIQRYNRTHPGVLDYTIKTARDEFQQGIYANRLVWQGDAVVGKQNNIVYAFELPVELGRAIEEVFPSMFRSKKHLRWFRKNFPRLTISGKELK